MNILGVPSPPTDNLYKFIAISGVLLLFASPVYWTLYELKVEERRTEESAAIYDLLGSLPPYQYYVPPAPGKQQSPSERKEWEAVKKTLAEQGRRFDAMRGEEFRRKARLRELERYEVVATVLAGFFLILGITAAVVGFQLWYVRVQRPLDRLLAMQLSEPEAPSPPSDAASDIRDPKS